jgi:hypothetical protein
LTKRISYVSSLQWSIYGKCRNWWSVEETETGHAISIIYDHAGVGVIYDNGQPQSRDVIITKEITDNPRKELERRKNNIKSFYAHMVYVQNVFAVNVDFHLKKFQSAAALLPKGTVHFVNSEGVVEIRNL